MDFSIKNCERTEYQEFLSMLNTAFGYGAENEWFEKNTPHCTPHMKDALDCEIEKHYIALCDGKLIGSVGAYDFDWIVSDEDNSFVVKAFGIGQVCCLTEYRGNNVMSSLLKYAINEMSTAGCAISFLRGDRFRYSHFGYDFGGNIVNFSFKRRDLDKLNAPFNMDFKKSTDYNELNPLYETLPSYIKRSHTAWKRHFERYNYEFFIGKNEGKEGYICVKNGDICVEVAGNGSIVLNLLNKYMEEKNLSRITVNHPYTGCLTDELSLMLYNKATWTEVVPYGLVAIHDSSKLFEMFSKTIEKQTRQKTEGLDAHQKEVMIRRLFGYVYHPSTESCSVLESLRPLCAWIPTTDNI